MSKAIEETKSSLLLPIPRYLQSPESERAEQEQLEAWAAAAVADHERVGGLARWRPTDYERHYLPALRLRGLGQREGAVLQNSADLHLHTEWSDGDDLDAVLERAVAARLDAIAITDHDVIEGALEARRRAHERRLPLAVVPGVEVSSRDGHIGALFVTRAIPANLDAAETIERIHAAGGIAVAHHPYVPRWIELFLGVRLGCRDLISTLPFDAVECSNAVPGRGVHYNLAAIRRLKEQRVRVAVTGSSDAHIARLVGKGRTFYAGNEGAYSLYCGLRNGFTQGAEGYWTTREKVAYYLHLLGALLRNTLAGNDSVN